MVEDSLSIYEVLNTNCTNILPAIDICNDTLCDRISNSNCSEIINWSFSEAPMTEPISPLTIFKADPQLEEFQEQSRFWVQRVLVPIIMTIGVIGNTITIVIMTQRRMRSSTNCYLAALAIFDMSYLVFSFLLSFQHYPHIQDTKYHFYWKVWPYILTLTDASSNSSVWLTVTFTIERYIAVCHPMKGKVICTESRARRMIVIVFIASFLITLPTAFEWKIVQVTNPETNVTKIQADYSELGKHPVYVSVYYWAISVLFIIIPFIILAVFNAFLIRSVHSSKIRRNRMTRRKETGDQAKQESKITIMLIAVVILFFICQLPTAVILLYRSFHHIDFGNNEDLLLRGLGNIFNFLMAINAAGNFVLYCLLSQKYRRTFLQIFCPCFKDKMTRLQSVYQNTIYSTIENESPNLLRKYSQHSTKYSAISKLNDGKVGPNTKVKLNSRSAHSSVCHPPSCSSAPSSYRTQGKLSFCNTVAVFGNGNNTCAEDTRYRRLLRGFRFPWKRQKISTGANINDSVSQYIDLKLNLRKDPEELTRFKGECEAVGNTNL